MKTGKEGAVAAATGTGYPDREATPRAALVALLLTAVAFTAIATAASAIDGATVPSSSDLDLALGGVTAATTVTLGALLVSLTRVGGRPTGFFLGVATMLLAMLPIGLGEIVPLLTDAADLGTVREASLAFVFVLYTLAVWPFRRSGLLPIAAAAAATLATVTVVSHLIGLGPGRPIETAWIVMAAAQGGAYAATGRARHAWVAVALAGFGLSEIGLASAQGGHAVWAIGVHTLRVIAVGSAIAGLVAAVVREAKADTRELAASRAHIADLERASELAQQAWEERDHEARSALAAIEFTAHTMRRRPASLDEAALEQLELALSSEIALLRRLITLPDAGRPPGPYRLTAALAGVVAYGHATGMDVRLDVAPELTAHGTQEALAEIAQIMIDNARIHAAGSRMTITGHQAGGYSIVRFDDDGPGIPAGSRREVFLRGRDAGHATSAGGRGLGLYVAKRLATEQHGDLWVEEAEGGGASFRVSLPTAAPATALPIAPEPERHEAARP